MRPSRLALLPLLASVLSLLPAASGGGTPPAVSPLTLGRLRRHPAADRGAGAAMQV